MFTFYLRLAREGKGARVGPGSPRRCFMIGYTLVGTNDLDRAKGFYDALFGVVGAGRVMEFEGAMCAWGVSMEVPMFGVTKPYDGKPQTIGNGTMIALVVDERAKVDALHAKALALGGADEGAPGIRG